MVAANSISLTIFDARRSWIFISVSPSARALQAAAEKPQLRFAKAPTAVLLQGLCSGAAALSFQRLEITPQLGTALLYLVAHFAALERCE
jgi:hypothetical protein